MNYFELHVGDYEAATAHLTMVEDAAYCRMLRIYYRTEKPLPVEIRSVCRMVRAGSKIERDAVQQVLSDFFELRDDGWHQARCDAELARFAAGEPEREVRKANEENRLRRHRAERAALFKKLTDAGDHAPWNIGTAELRVLVQRLAATPATAPATQPATEPATPATEPATEPATAPATPATATQTPLPKHQTPEIEKRARGARLPLGWVLPEEWAAWARTQRPDLEPVATAERFRDYWLGRSGSSGCKLDWFATWRNWVRDERAPIRLANAGAPEPAWRTEQRERMGEFAGPFAAKPTRPVIANVEPEDAAARLVG